MSQLEKYNRKYAEKLPQFSIDIVFDCALVIPCFSESETFVNNLKALLSVSKKNVCAIVVVNAPDNAALEDVTINNKLLSFFQKTFPLVERCSELATYQFQQHRICVLDKTSVPLPVKQGVGLARKIGCDFALQLFERNRVKTPAIFVSDADVIFPVDYFSRITPAKNIAAWIYPFSHLPDDNPLLAKGIAAYECYLQSYVDGLARAGSPYAFHTIGSTMAIHPEAYAKVRGFPRRAAAEDFYMLNKLAKVGEIVQLDGEPLLLQGRLSHRVPFGTGDAMHKVLAGKEYRAYEPVVFDYLSVWLHAVSRFTLDMSANEIQLCLQSVCASVRVDKFVLMRVLDDMQIFELIEQAKMQVKDTPTFTRYIHTWFDGFKTMKFIRALSIMLVA